jgi:hypothetical protein
MSVADVMRTIARFVGVPVVSLLVGGCFSIGEALVDHRDRVDWPTGGRISATLKPPILTSPANRSVFSHYPRRFTLRWLPAAGTPKNVAYLVQWQSTDPNTKQFGNWAHEKAPGFAFRTPETSFADEFIGAQPGRWRVKAVDKTRESNWSEWRYFLFLN